MPLLCTVVQVAVQQLNPVIEVILGQEEEVPSWPYQGASSPMLEDVALDSSSCSPFTFSNLMAFVGWHISYYDSVKVSFPLIGLDLEGLCIQCCCFNLLFVSFFSFFGHKVSLCIPDMT